MTWLHVSGEDKYHGVEIETTKGCFIATKEDLTKMAAADDLFQEGKELLSLIDNYIDANIIRFAKGSVADKIIQSFRSAIEKAEGK